MSSQLQIDSQTQSLSHLLPTPPNIPQKAQIEILRGKLRRLPDNRVDPTLKRNLEHGWLLIYALEWDRITWQRWQYWLEIVEKSSLPNTPIPQIDFCSGSTSPEGIGSLGRRHLEKCLDLIPNQGEGSWQCLSRWQYLEYFLDWLLFAFGHPGQTKEPEEPSFAKGASIRLYQFFNLPYFVLFPWDYLGGLLAENHYGKKPLAFYPTPHTVVETMTIMQFNDLRVKGQDTRVQSFFDSCAGSGRFLLYASNYSLRLSGADIDHLLVKCILVNGYLYAPWLVKPIPFLDKE